jgi:hypothetical protein
MDPSDALTDWIVANPSTSTLVGLGLLCVAWLWVHLSTRGDPPGKVGKPLPPVSTAAVSPKGPVFIPFELGPVTIDLQPTLHDTIHTVIGGTSGLGKTTSVLPLFDLPIGVLCVALDNTRPIAAKVRSLSDGIEWTNEPEWGLGLDLLGGKSRVASEVLVEGWAAKTAGDTGKWRDIAAGRLWTAIDQLDRTSVPRSIPQLGAMLLERTGNVEADRACQDWAGRLVSLARWLGPALGSDLDLVQAMRDRRKVLLRLNRFVNPRLAPMLGGMLLVHARRVAEEAGVPFVLIVEEAGQMGIYEQQLSALAQAGRDRGVPLVLLTQNASSLPLEVVNNTSVWVSFAQEARREVVFASERMRLEPEQLQREAFKDHGRGWCYVRGPGLPTTLVRVEQQHPRALSATDSHTSKFTDTPTRTPRRWIVHEVDLRRAEHLMLPAPSEAEATLVQGIYREGECERWSGKHDRAGHKKECPKDCADQKHVDGCYGLVWWPLEEPTETRVAEWQRVHRVRWELAFGPLPIDVRTGKKLTLDHRRTCYKDCSRLDHLAPATLSENSRRRWRVRGVGAAPAD